MHMCRFMISVFVFAVAASAATAEKTESPVKLVGEKLFRDPRFSQYFFAHSAHRINEPLAKGDTVVDLLLNGESRIAHPYRGQAISCAACHFVGQAKEIPGAGPRAYTDFSSASPIPDRGDGRLYTVRNSPNMVGSALNSNWLLHHDGEFRTPEDLVIESFLGRNMGWLPEERQQAIAHFARVIRDDNGNFPTDTELRSLSYSLLFSGQRKVAVKFRLPPTFRININQLSDQQIIEYIGRLVGSYLRELDFERDERGLYSGSPWDQFLALNSLPRTTHTGETAPAYAEKLARLIRSKRALKFIPPGTKLFSEHEQSFQFTELELRGYEVFAGRGRCTSCHAPPDFTDHLFHNTGLSQAHYESVHGKGTFAAVIAQITDRQQQIRPAARPELDKPLNADLGAWHMLLNPLHPNLQTKIKTYICLSQRLDCAKINAADILNRARAVVKTPTLRDLGHSHPYGHTGMLATLEQTVNHYQEFATRSRAGEVVNPDPELTRIYLKAEDTDALVAFLKSLNEDYD